MRRPLLLALSFLIFLSACSRSKSLPRDRVAALVSSLTQAPLPPSATNVFGSAVSVFTTGVNVRFECSQEDLSSFLKASPVLNDELVHGNRTVVNTMSGDGWWRPDALTSVSGSQQSWRTTNGLASALLMSGQSELPGKVVVYLAVTIE